MAKGSKIRAVIYEENAWGVAPTTPEGLELSKAEVGVAMKRGSNKPRVLRSDRNPAEGSLGRKDAGGPLVLQPGVRELPFLMKHALGTVVTTGTGPFTHTIKIGDLPPGLTLDKFFSDMSGLGCVERYLGYRINQFSFGASDDGLLELTLDGVAADEVDDSALLDATPKLYALQPFAMPKLTFTEGGAAMKIGKNWNLTYMNNLDTDTGRTIGNGGTLSDLPEGTVGIEFKWDVLFKSYALLNKAKNETASSIGLNFAAQSVGHSAAFALNEVHYELEEPTAKGPGGIVVPMNGYAYYTSDAAASALVFTAINDVTSLATIPA